MINLETLTVPRDLGEWLQSRGIGESGAYFTTLDALFRYWETVVGSPTGDFISQNKKELIEVIIGVRDYEVEESLYHALVKGHELMVDDDTLTSKYWNFDTFNGDLFPSNRFTESGRFLIEMSQSEWNKIGINDSNAEFVRVGEVIEE